MEAPDSQSEVVGIALQRIGSILENDENAEVQFSEEVDHGVGIRRSEVHPTTTSVKLEVSGVEE